VFLHNSRGLYQRFEIVNKLMIESYDVSIVFLKTSIANDDEMAATLSKVAKVALTQK
jgi:hypothetical protein